MSALPRPGIRPRELAGACLGLGTLAAVLLADHVREGGLYWADDWFHARLARFPADGFAGLTDPYNRHFRPLLSLLSELPFRILGDAPGPHIALTVVVAVASCAAFYWLLRTVGFETWHAGAIAGLALVFPWADAGRLWAEGGALDFAPLLLMVGMTLSLRSLEASRRRAIFLRVGGLAAYVASILVYEAVFVVGVLAVLLYARVAGWRTALRWWALDLVVLGVPVLYVLSRLPGRYTHPFQPVGEFHRMAHMGSGAWTLLGRSLNPLPGGAPAAAAMAAALVAVATVVAIRSSLPSAPDVRRWLVVLAAGVVAIVAAYAPFAHSARHYTPLAAGVGDRINIVAAFGFALVVYALVMLVARLAGGATRRPALASPIAIVLVGVIAVGWAGALVRRAGTWDGAAVRQRLEVALVAARLPHLPDHATVYAFGWPNYTAPGVPVFALESDLSHALEIRLGNPTVRAFPMRGSGHSGHVFTRWVCGTNWMYPVDGAYGPAMGSRYGSAWFVHVASKRLLRITDQRQCLVESARFGHPPRLAVTVGVPSPAGRADPMSLRGTGRRIGGPFGMRPETSAGATSARAPGRRR